LGSDSFAVVSIGFDTANDSPARMQSFARMQGIHVPNWRFLAIRGEEMQRLAEDLGFVYFGSPRGFDHLAQVSVLDQEGRVYRQIYGESFDSPFLVEPLKDLVFGRAANLVSVDGLINRLRLFCTIYDPSAGRYRFDYAIFIGFGIGLFALAGIGTIVASNWLRLMHDRRGRAG
jgi:protein SCO1/2